MKPTILLLACIFTFAGCGPSTLVSTTGESGTISVHSLNQRVRTEEVTVHYSDGSMSAVREFRIQNDSAYWKNGATDAPERMPLSGIHHLTTGSSRLLGGLAGFAAGLAAGGIVGLILGNRNAPTGEDHTWGVLLSTGMGAGAGAIIGTVVGTSLSDHCEYELGRKRTDR